MSSRDTLLLVLLVNFADAGLYLSRATCRADQMEIVVLRKEFGSDSVQVVERLDPNTDIQHDVNISQEVIQVRKLTFNELAQWSDPMSADEVYGYDGFTFDDSIFRGLQAERLVLNGTEAHSSASLLNASEAYTYYYARECDCFSSWKAPISYCPMTITTCLRERYGGPPGCRNPEKGVTFGWSMNLFLLMWFFALFLCCFQKKGLGANVRDFFLSLCIPRYNEWLANRIMDRNPNLVRQLYYTRFLRHQSLLTYPRRWVSSVIDNPPVVQQQEGLQQQELPQENQQSQVEMDSQKDSVVTSLLLRTSTYRKSKSVMEDEDCCTICFGPFVDGDRVGVLETCSHTFHVACLKPWIQRRNVCPLCQKTGIAKPQFGPISFEVNVQTSPDVVDNELPLTEATSIHSLDSPVDQRTSHNEEGNQNV